jgi:hypothetical protein
MFVFSSVTANCSEIAKILLKNYMCFCGPNQTVFFKQVLRIYDGSGFFGKNLSPWLREEIGKYISDQRHCVSYEDMFNILVSLWCMYTGADPGFSEGRG